MRTYIQSGNVLFGAGEARVAELTRAVEQRLTERLGQPVRAVVFPRTRYRAAVRAAPAGWGRDDDRKHNALFTLRGTTPRRAVSDLPALKPDIESLAIGPGVVFWSISKAHQTRTTWMKLAATTGLPAGYGPQPPDGLPLAGAPRGAGRDAPIIPACRRCTARCSPL